MPDRFSERQGYRGSEQEITIREDAPEGLRFAIPLIAQAADMSPSAMRRVVCQVLLIRPDPLNWSDYPNVWEEVNRLIEGCPWFKVYDIAEGLFTALALNSDERAESLQDQLNQYFLENGIGWQMTDGQILYRGSESFSEATHEAAEILSEGGRTVAAKEIHEALRDISRRPEPDLTGAIQHAMATLECTARDVAGKPKALSNVR